MSEVNFAVPSNTPVDVQREVVAMQATTAILCEFMSQTKAEFFSGGTESGVNYDQLKRFIVEIKDALLSSEE